MIEISLKLHKAADDFDGGQYIGEQIRLGWMQRLRPKSHRRLS